MKTRKFFMMGLAVLALTACNNEENLVNNDVVNGAVAVTIVKPSTRALSTGETVAVEGEITVTLSGSNGYEESININTSSLTESTKLTFWNVTSIEGLKLTATINGGISSYTTTSIISDAPETSTPLWKVAPKDVPAYGETTTFTRAGSGSPDMDNDGETEEGAVSGDENKIYDLYSATITMAIPMARLEVGDITFEQPTTGKSVYATLIYTGCYLDGYATNGAAYTNGSYPAVATGFGNYWFENGAGIGTNGVADLKYAADSNHDFITTPITEAGSFNFFAGNQNPRFKLYFKSGTLNDGANIDFPRYAMITKYKKAGSEIILQNGHIYKITGVKLNDDNIIPDEEGNDMYGVTVTVEEAQWTVETIDAEWEN